MRSSGAVAEGIVRVGDDPDSDLRVRIVAVEGTLALMTEKVELGQWPVGSVTIVAVADDRFDFTVDGDTITFFPDNPDGFSKLGIVSEAISKRRLRRSQRRAQRSRGAVSTSEPEERTLPPKPKRKTKRQQRKAEKQQRKAEKQQRKAEKERRKAEKERRRAEKQQRKTEKARDAASSPKPTTPSKRRSTDRADKARVRKAERASARESRARPKKTRDAPVGSAARQWMATKLRVFKIWFGWKLRLGWYWVLDELRNSELLWLDRIPTASDEKRLRPGHEHVFHQHGTVAGLKRYVCRCGKIRLSPQSEDDGGDRDESNMDAGQPSDAPSADPEEHAPDGAGF